MSTTIIPPCPPLLRKFRWQRTARTVVKLAYEGYAEDIRNTDKASDMDDHSYYCGRIDVYREVIFVFTDVWLP